MLNLGLSEVGNNWKLILGNFLIMFLVQIALAFADVFNGVENAWPSEWMICRIVFNSLAATLIFYGFNKFVLEKKE